MQRTKVLAVVAALVGAGAAAIVLAGGASAASWHVYKGDVYAGHAYGLQVPADAKSIELTLEGAGSASFSVFDPAGAKVGYYGLTPDLKTASVAQPTAGQYVVYVYDIKDGALTLRVDSATEPTLDLQSVDLARTDTTIGTFPEGKLDQVITTDLKVEPVFATLLYKGSARDLSATVSSDKGAIVTITNETATAFSPGVWTSQTGTRAFDGAKLSGAKYNVEVHAAQFEGTMVLTTLALDVKAPVPTATTPAPQPSTNVPTKAPAVPLSSAATFPLNLHRAVAFDALAGKLTIWDPELAGHATKHNSSEYDSSAPSVVTLYAPDDTLLTVVSLDAHAPSATVTLPGAGEYVAYTHSAGKGHLLAALDGATVAPKLRELAVSNENVSAAFDQLDGGKAEIQLKHVPITLQLDMRESIGALTSAALSNAKGVVAANDELVASGPVGPFAGGTYVNMSNFAAGVHTLTVDGLYNGVVQVRTLFYERAKVVAPAAPEAGNGTAPPAPPAPDAPPAPPAPPMPPAPTAPEASPRVLAQELLGLF